MSDSKVTSGVVYKAVLLAFGLLIAAMIFHALTCSTSYGSGRWSGNRTGPAGAGPARGRRGAHGQSAPLKVGLRGWHVCDRPGSGSPVP